MTFVSADPYAWPYNGDLRPENTALIVIDMQTDFCGEGGYIDLLGYDISLTRACIGPIKRVLEAMRAAGVPRAAHARGPPPRPGRPAGQQALALAQDEGRHRHRRPRAARAGAGPRRAGLGHHPRALPRARRADHRQAGQGLVLRHRPRPDPAHAGHRQHHPHRHHHRRLRAHHHARGQRPRLRVPAAVATAAAPPTSATTTRRSRWSRCRTACSARSPPPRRCSRPWGEARPPPPPRPRGRRPEQALRRLRWRSRASPCGSRRAPSTRCSARTAPARARSSSASWATTAPTPGEVRLDGRAVTPASPRQAQALGIGMVYQHFTLVPNMTVAENLVLARGKLPFVIDWARERRELEAFFQEVPFRLPLDAPGAHAGGRREAEARDLQAALPAEPHRHPRRADLRADAGRGRRGAGAAGGHGPPGEAAQHRPHHPQVPRGERLRRRGHRAAARPARGGRPGRALSATPSWRR